MCSSLFDCRRQPEPRDQLKSQMQIRARQPDVAADPGAGPQRLRGQVIRRVWRHFARTRISSLRSTACSSKPQLKTSPIESRDVSHLPIGQVPGALQGSGVGRVVAATSAEVGPSMPSTVAETRQR